MSDQPVQILLVDDEPELSEMIDECLCHAVEGIQLTSTSSAAEALREELTSKHDIVLVSQVLPDGEGLAFVRELRISNRCPIILLADCPSAEEMIEALRLRVSDVLTKPFDLDALCSSVKDVLDRREKRRHRQRRTRRLRRMVSRIIRERRDLRQRMDLICRDLVHAYRGLAQKVAQSGVLTQEPAE